MNSGDSSAEGRGFAWEQQRGMDPDWGEQQDRMRVDWVHTAGGTRVLLAVVVDGEGSPGAGGAAHWMVERVFGAVRKGRGEGWTALLREALQGGARALPEGVAAAVSAMVVHRSRLYFAHAGHCSAWLVGGGEAVPLVAPSGDLLEKGGANAIRTGPAGGVPVRPGDRVVLASDGLTKRSLEDGRAYVSARAIAKEVRGNAPREAARHLVSLAMGRDAEDNVSVAVLQVPGRAGAGGLLVRILLAALGALGLLLLGFTLADRLRREAPAPELDYGYAVVLEGAVRVDSQEGAVAERLATLPPGSRLTSVEQVRLSLQSSGEGASELSAAALYLAPGTTVILERIAPVVGGGEGANARIGVTRLAIEAGQLLLLREGGLRRYELTLPEGSVSLEEPGAAAVGLWVKNAATVVDTLRGACTLEGENGKVLALVEGESSSFLGGQPGAAEPLAARARSAWDSLCGGCLGP